MDWAKVPLIVKWTLLGTNKQKHDFTITQAIFWQFLTEWRGQKTFGLWMDSHMLTLCECERDRFFLCNPGWLGTRSVDQAVIERTEICLPVSLVLELSSALFFFFSSFRNWKTWQGNSWALRGKGSEDVWEGFLWLEGWQVPGRGLQVFLSILWFSLIPSSPPKESSPSRLFQQPIGFFLYYVDQSGLQLSNS